MPNDALEAIRDLILTLEGEGRIVFEWQARHFEIAATEVTQRRIVVTLQDSGSTPF